MIAAVPEKKAPRGASRYDAVIATLVGVCALCVSGYTAYMQRQQVRATVYPILEFTSSNAPDIHFTLSNKGVGPAIIRDVIVRVDGEPKKNWGEVFAKLLGGRPEDQHGSETDMSNHVLSAGELIEVITPFASDGNPIKFNRSDPVWVKMDKDRFHVTVEICYSSTLGECWTLRSSGSGASSTSECSRCPAPSAISFEQ